MKARSFLAASLVSVVGFAIDVPRLAAASLPQKHEANRPLVAQVFRTTVTLPAGQTIATRLASASTLYINTGETVAAQLRVERDVLGSNGMVLIPAGATIEGEFVPVSGGSKFVARTLTSRGATVSLGAESALIHDVKDPRQTDAASILTDAAIGAAGAAVLAGVLGDRAIATEEVLAGAAAGAIVGNVTAPQATVVDANTDIVLTTNRNLTFTRGGD